MKYLNEFFNYVKESKVDLEDIDHMLLSIKDLGIDYHSSKGTLFGGKYNNHEYVRINFTFNNLSTEKIIANYEFKPIDDNRIWDLFDDLLSFRSRLLDSDKFTNCLIKFYKDKLTVIFIGVKLKENKLLELSQRMKSNLSSMKTDFSYDTIVEYIPKDEYSIKDYIRVKTGYISYTYRKLKSIIKRSLPTELNYSELEIKETELREEFDDIVNIITLK